MIVCTDFRTNLRARCCSVITFISCWHQNMAASMRLSRAVTLLLRRSENIRRLPQSSFSAGILKCSVANSNHQLNRFICTTQFVRNEQQTSPKGIDIMAIDILIIINIFHSLTNVFCLLTLSGVPEKREFQAETRMLLDIVAKSLYSEKEVGPSSNIHVLQFIHRQFLLLTGIYSRTHIQCFRCIGKVPLSLPDGDRTGKQSKAFGYKNHSR